MPKSTPLFNKRVLENYIRTAKSEGTTLPSNAKTIVEHWSQLLASGSIDLLNESQVEQTFNNEIFCKLLGYKQIGEASEASLLPKGSGASGKDFPDFVLGRFNPACKIDEWIVVGEIKDSKVNLDLPQMSRKNKETPIEQGFRYASKGRPGIEWIIVSNFREIRLYRNGYSGAYHAWAIQDLCNDEKLYEFFLLLRPDGLIDNTMESLSLRIFKSSISAGQALTEGFYALYKIIQHELINQISLQSASEGLTVPEIYGKIHKLLNRVLFIAFCEDHPAELLPRNTLQKITSLAQRQNSEGAYWNLFKQLFVSLNAGGVNNGIAYNAFNGGLFAPDIFFDNITLPNNLFTKQFQAGKGRRKSLTITGIFGFDVYDFAEDLNVQALGAIFEQSLKDVIKKIAHVRGTGEVDVTSQKVGGVYYTPREITSYMIRRAFSFAIGKIESEIRSVLDTENVADKRIGPRGKKTAASVKKEIIFYNRLSERLKTFCTADPACGSGAFLVEAMEQLHNVYEKINAAYGVLVQKNDQFSMMDLDRIILRNNLHGIDILPESVEISKLSVWLRTAKKRDKLETLDNTIVVGDSLRSSNNQYFDVIVGNPPWGADLEGWTSEELAERFPDCGNEKDSYAIFIIRAWEMLKPNGILAFITPNSWLTVDSYTKFRAWLHSHFELLEINNVWKIFDDVNHDATILIARKRSHGVCNELDNNTTIEQQYIAIRSIPRGVSENEKRKCIAQEKWVISHETSQAFQCQQQNYRFETIYHPNISNELDKISARCTPLGNHADITVGIQVYHHTRVSKEFIKRNGFHGKYKIDENWFEYIESNQVQRYFTKSYSNQWLMYSSRLHDKRELLHYQMPRILVQQIFWQRLSACLQHPTEPLLYLNTLFAIYNSRDIPLECLLGIINSRFISASYERRSNRLFGDKFPKVSKIDLATIPIPNMGEAVIKNLGSAAILLQNKWACLRKRLDVANISLSGIDPKASIEYLALTNYTSSTTPIRLLLMPLTNNGIL